MRHFGWFQTMCANRKLPNFFQAKNAYSFDDYIVLHVTLAGIATALQAAAVPRFFAVGKTLTLWNFTWLNSMSHNIVGKPCERWTTGVKIAVETTGFVKKLFLWKCLFRLQLKTLWLISWKKDSTKVTHFTLGLFSSFGSIFSWCLYFHGVWKS